jgi:hypothetical protein
MFRVGANDEGLAVEAIPPPAVSSQLSLLRAVDLPALGEGKGWLSLAAERRTIVLVATSR